MLHNNKTKYLIYQENITRHYEFKYICLRRSSLVDELIEREPPHLKLKRKTKFLLKNRKENQNNHQRTIYFLINEEL